MLFRSPGRRKICAVTQAPALYRYRSLHWSADTGVPITTTSVCPMRTLITALTLPALLITSALSPASHAHIPSANPMEHSRPFPAGPSRQLEDYRFLDDPARRTDPLDGLRYHRLGDKIGRASCRERG